MPDITIAEKLDALEEVWPETPTVNVRFSVQLFKSLANGVGGIRLVSLGEPDVDGFYTPDMRVVG